VCIVTRLIVVSFDIDGTLEVGDPPGPIALATVRRAKELGCIVGSCSDRPLSHQHDLWRDHGIVMDFAALKTDLPVVRDRFPGASYYHIGDTDVDRSHALRAGFTYLMPDPAAVDRLLRL
jgi:hypothetical protein